MQMVESSILKITIHSARWLIQSNYPVSISYNYSPYKKIQREARTKKDVISNFPQNLKKIKISFSSICLKTVIIENLVENEVYQHLPIPCQHQAPFTFN